MYLIEFSAKSLNDINVMNVAYVGELSYPMQLSALHNAKKLKSEITAIENLDD